MKNLLLLLILMTVSCIADPIDEVGSIQQSLDWRNIDYITDAQEELDCEGVDSIFIQTYEKKGARQLVECNAPDGDVQLFPSHDPGCQSSSIATAETGYHVENLVFDPEGPRVLVIKIHADLVYACVCNYSLCEP
jgi:hypothetical protein